MSMTMTTAPGTVEAAMLDVRGLRMADRFR